MLRYVGLFMSLMLCVSCTSMKEINLREGIESFKVQNYRDAFIRLRTEAEHGQPDAQYAIGYMYYYGQGVVENRKKACGWITRAAAAGQKDAILAMRRIYRSTSGLGCRSR